MPSSTGMVLQQRVPFALCEAQGYAYAAVSTAAKLAHALLHRAEAIEFLRRAEYLRNRFNDDFWCEEMSTYVMALDGAKRQCCVLSSNAGQCLFTGIATHRRAALVAERMLSGEWFSGWGIRTISSSEARFNPMSYHNGSIWPHDNALISFRGMCELPILKWMMRRWISMLPVLVRMSA